MGLQGVRDERLRLDTWSRVFSGPLDPSLEPKFCVEEQTQCATPEELDSDTISGLVSLRAETRRMNHFFGKSKEMQEIVHQHRDIEEKRNL